MDIKQEDVLSDSQNETEFFIKNVTDSDSNITIKTEVKSENVLQDFTSQKEREFVPEDPVMKYDSDHAIHHKVEIKEEPYWLETDTSSNYEDIKDEELLPVKSARLCTGAVPRKSPLHFADFYNGKDHSGCESDVMAEVPSEHRDAGLKQKNIKSNRCNTCGKSFTRLSNLKLHRLIHEGKKPHKCEICKREFNQLPSLKRHRLLHEDKKPHKCELCGKEFIQLLKLKKHNWIHEGIKPHKCKTCDKRFTCLSYLKMHNLMHEGRTPYRCERCDKNFINMSSLKNHILIHEGTRPHKCGICERGFTELSNLKQHILIHEGTRPHKCAICLKGFTQLSSLKKHGLVHRVKIP